MTFILSNLPVYDRRILKFAKLVAAWTGFIALVNMYEVE